MALTNVVVRATPLKRTTDPPTKLVPLRVKVKLAPPAVTLVGDRVVIIGIGMDETVRLTAFEFPPPGAELLTVIGNAPTTAMSEARICAVN